MLWLLEILGYMDVSKFDRQGFESQKLLTRPFIHVLISLLLVNLAVRGFRWRIRGRKTKEEIKDAKKVEVRANPSFSPILFMSLKLMMTFFISLQLIITFHRRA